MNSSDFRRRVVGRVAGSICAAVLLGSLALPALAATAPRVIVKFDKAMELKAREQTRRGALTPSDTAVARTLAVELTRSMGMAGAMRLVSQRRLAVGSELYELQASSPLDLQRVLAAMRKAPGVAYAVEDRRLRINLIPNDPMYSEQWSYYEPVGGIRAQQAWNISTGVGVVVGVIDTGYRPHRDLRDNILPGYDFIADVATAGDGNGRDRNPVDPGDFEEGDGGLVPSSWHGTHVSGTVAARTNNGVGVAGVAFGARVVPLRTLGTGGGFTSDIVDAVVWGAGGAVARVPVNANPAKVLNLSLGGEGACSPPFTDAIAAARSLGTTVVVAAGNSNDDAEFFEPASCPGAITVAATDRRGYRAPYSNIGKVVDIAAPGGDSSSSLGDGVLSTLNEGLRGPGADSYDFYNGTSMASPHVAGVAALMLSLDPTLTPDEVECTLKATARPFPSAANCPNCGAGIVDAQAAVVAVRDGQVSSSCGVAVVERNLPLDREIAVSGLRGDQVRYKLRVNGGQRVTLTSSRGIGDLDLYASHVQAPSLGAADCRSLNIGNGETCVLSSPPGPSTMIRIMAYGYREFRGARLLATVQDVVREVLLLRENLAGAEGTDQLFDITVPPGALNLGVTLAGGPGDADLFLTYEGVTVCASFSGTNNESCALDQPPAGVYQIRVNSYLTFSGARLEAYTERLQ